MPPSVPLSGRYVAVGIEDTNFVANLGSMFVTLVIMQLLILFAYFTKFLKKTKV